MLVEYPGGTPPGKTSVIYTTSTSVLDALFTNTRLQCPLSHYVPVSYDTFNLLLVNFDAFL